MSSYFNRKKVFGGGKNASFLQERRAEEVKKLQVKLEEQEEVNKTLNDVNSVLRIQLASATKSNEQLMKDVKNLNESWNKTKREQEIKV